MTNFTIQNKKIFSVFEALYQSGSNYIFFALLSIFLEPLKNGEFHFLFVGTQLPFLIATSWLILPMMNYPYNSLYFLHFCLSKIRYFLINVPLIIGGYLYLSGSDFSVKTWLVLSFYSLSLCYLEIFRHYFIIEKKVRRNIILVSVRFLPPIFYVLIAIIFHTEISLLNLFVVMTLPMTLVVTNLFYKLWSKEHIQIDSDFKSKSHMVLGGSQLVNTTVFTLIFKNVDLAFYGIVQAYRSLLNIIPFCVQYIEVYWVRNNRDSQNMIRKPLNLLLLSSFGLILTSLVYIVLSKVFISISCVTEIYFIVSMIIVIQSVSRVLNISNRNLGKNRKFYISSILMLLVAFSVLIFNSYTSLNGYVLLGIQLAQVIGQLLIYK